MIVLKKYLSSIHFKTVKFLLLIFFKYTLCYNDEFELTKKLLSYHKDKTPHIRPMLNASESLNILFDISLVQVLDVNVKDQSITVLLWKKLEWMDQIHIWSPQEFGNITSMEMKPHLLWVPDIYLYNK